MLANKKRYLISLIRKYNSIKQTNTQWELLFSKVNVNNLKRAKKQKQKQAIQKVKNHATIVKETIRMKLNIILNQKTFLPYTLKMKIICYGTLLNKASKQKKNN